METLVWGCLLNVADCLLLRIKEAREVDWPDAAVVAFVYNSIFAYHAMNVHV